MWILFGKTRSALKHLHLAKGMDTLDAITRLCRFLGRPARNFRFAGHKADGVRKECRDHSGIRWGSKSKILFRSTFGVIYIYIIYTSFFAFSVDVLDFDLHPCSFLSKFLIELHTILVEELKSDLEAFLDILRSQKC